MNPIGYNILAQTVHDRSLLYSRIANLKPAVVVVMDDNDQKEIAANIRYVSPKTIIVQRNSLADENEKKLHLIMSPQDYVNYAASALAPNSVFQCFNEPDGQNDIAELVRWMVEVYEIAGQRGVPICGLNFGVGQPHTKNVSALDPVLRVLAKYPNLHYLGLHEYFIDTPVVGRDLVGRCQFVLERADFLGIPRPRILITEYGRDIGGGHEDGWRTVFSEDYYLKLLKQGASFYAANGVIGAAVFCYGFGGGNMWFNFDVQSASPDFHEGLKMSPTIPVPPTSLSWDEKQVAIVSNMVEFVNIRPEPTTNKEAIDVAYNGDIIQVADKTVTANGYTWAIVRRLNTEQQGYIRTDVARFVDPVNDRVDLLEMADALVAQAEKLRQAIIKNQQYISG